jgi:hypothetical protein
MDLEGTHAVVFYVEHAIQIIVTIGIFKLILIAPLTQSYSQNI